MICHRHLAQLMGKISADSQAKLITAKNKKAWNLYLLLVPRVEALALPSLSERATKEPTPICKWHERTIYYIPYGHPPLL